MDKKINELDDIKIITGLISQADAYYVISVKGDRHVSSVGGLYVDENKSLIKNNIGITKLLAGMLGSIQESIQTGSGNGAVLLTLFQSALDNIPELKKILTK